MIFFYEYIYLRVYIQLNFELLSFIFFCEIKKLNKFYLFYFRNNDFFFYIWTTFLKIHISSKCQNNAQHAREQSPVKSVQSVIQANTAVECVKLKTGQYTSFSVHPCHSLNPQQLQEKRYVLFTLQKMASRF